MIRYTERHSYTREQVEQHLADALEILGALELDDELRPIAFDRALNMLSAKQVLAEQHELAAPAVGILGPRQG